MALQQRYTPKRRVHETLPAPDLDALRGKEGLLNVYQQATDWEKRQGNSYYDRQRGRILTTTRNYPLDHSVGAFCALSPNNSEKITYRDLIVCSKIADGLIPEGTKTGAYPVNKAKALRILRGEHPLEVLGGRKVLAFYHNTLNPLNSEHVTIDGHIFSVWKGTRYRVLQVPHIGIRLYAEIAADIRVAADQSGVSAPQFQATIWLTWKRLHRVLYNPQLDFCWELDDD